MMREASLWSNIYMAALKAPDLSSDLRASCLLSGYDGVQSMRYAPVNTLSKARMRRCRFTSM